LADFVLYSLNFLNNDLASDSHSPGPMTPVGSLRFEHAMVFLTELDSDCHGNRVGMWARRDLATESRVLVVVRLLFEGGEVVPAHECCKGSLWSRTCSSEGRLHPGLPLSH